MGHVDKAVRVSDSGRPDLNLWAFHLDRASAVPADEVVVVLITRATPISRLSIVTAKGVEVAVLCETAELVVDRCKPNVLTSGSKLGVEILGGAELSRRIENGGKGALLAR